MNKGRKPYKKKENVKVLKSFRLSPECHRILERWKFNNKLPMVKFIEDTAFYVAKHMKINYELGVNIKEEM